MKAPVYSKEGKKKGELILNPEIYGARVNDRLLELVRNAYSANLRHGTADTKTRKEVSGGGKKPWKQKGTGRARHGSTRSPIWKGGGVSFGPHPRSYYVELPRTMKRAALISALSWRAAQKNLFVLEEVKLEKPKTRELVEIIGQLPLAEKRGLCVVKEIETNLERASRNITGLMEFCRARDVNAFHILQREKIAIEQDALPVIEARLLQGGGLPAAKTAEASAESKTKAKKVSMVKKRPVKARTLAYKKVVKKKTKKKPARKKKKS